VLNSPVCLDANLVVRLVESGERESPIVALWRQWREDGRPVVAPTLLYYEVSNALHRYVAHKVFLPEEAAALLDAALRLRITLFGDASLHRRALLVAERFRLPSSHDAHYLAMAEMFGAEFWTADRRLAQAVGPALPWVRVLEEVS
jgi:predicted nucleic acid-binding protein